MTDHPKPPAGSASAWSDIQLVAAREISTRVKTRSFVISTILTLVIVVGLIVAYGLLNDDDSNSNAVPSTTTVAQSGVDPAVQTAVTKVGTALGLKIEFVATPTGSTRQQATDGDVEAAVVRDGAGYRIYSKGDSLDATLDAALRGGIANAATAAALTEKTGNADALNPGPVTFTTAPAPPKPAANPEHDQRMRTALIGVILLIMTVFGGGIAVATGVIEEKASRIVEILLATIKPARLLWGKILGIGVVMVGSTILTAAVALVAAVATGVVGSFAVARTVVLASTIWLILGFVFYAVLYAAMGAMLSRQEELSGTTWPLSVAALGTFYAVIFGAGSPDSTLFQWLAWIPPFSAGIQPMRIADGSASTVEIVGSVAVMVIACAAAVFVAGRIYHRSVLSVGTRVSWRDAVGLGTAQAQGPKA